MPLCQILKDTTSPEVDIAGTDPLRRITLLYHFTDRRNLPSIREHGGLYPMTKLKKKRIEVLAPGGNEWSQDADGMKGMDGYIHLCFRNNHPMEYLARQNGRIGDTIFLQIHPDVLTWDGVLFTDDVARRHSYHRGSARDHRF